MCAQVLTTISPNTNKAILTRDEICDSSGKDLVDTALKAFESFRATPLSERQEIVKKALDLMLEKQDDLALELTSQMGRPISYAAKEVTTAVLRGQHLLRVSDQALQDSPGDTEGGFIRFIRKVPLGPVLIIFAWNYPYLILVNSLIPALLAGNSVILKPSPQTPTVAEQMAGVFEKAGLPEGVLQYFHCGSPTKMESILRNPRVAHICFTGSVSGGLAVQRAAADRVVGVGLELGGKDPAYVRRDVDIPWAAEEIVDGAIFNSGQSCCSIERVYVDAAIYDEFVSAVQSVLSGYVVGNPFERATQIGPVVSKRSADTITAQVQDALAKGARDSTPENPSFRGLPTVGNFVKPTLLTEVNHGMVVMKDETFGPIIPVMEVSGDEEAIRLMNDSDFGLTASIWTKDTCKAQQLANDVEAGTVFINRADYPSPDLAWTGWKNSGRGVTLSKFGFEQFVKLKSYHCRSHPE